MSTFKTKLVSILALGASVLTPSLAMAHSYTFSGIVAVSKGLNLLCTVTVVKTPDHDAGGNHLDTGSVTITIAPPSDPRCAVLSVDSNPMRYEQGPAGAGGWKEMTVYDFYASTITIGDCHADEVVVKKREVTPGVWEMDVTTVIPGDPGTPDCVIDGVIPQV